MKKDYDAIYRRAYNRHKEHREPKTDTGWHKMAESISLFKDSSEFEQALIMAIAEEIQRSHSNLGGKRRE